MPQLTLPCPYCRAEKVGFSARGSVPVRPGVALTLLFFSARGAAKA